MSETAAMNGAEWLARALAGSSSATPGRSLPELAEQLLIFRRKTRW